MNGPCKTREQGFSLIEVMIVVIVLGILASIAIPSYQEYVRRGNRADAKSVMLQAANWMQQCYTLNNTFTPNPPATCALPASLSASPASGTPKFSVTLSAVAAQAYTLQAAPTGGYADPKCGTLTITNSGARTSGGTETTDYCWNK